MISDETVLTGQSLLSWESEMDMSPTISVIIPAYNVEDYIAGTLESLFAQRRIDFEAIVINDGSTDKTEDRIQPFLPRIRYIRQENRGVMAARNTGLQLARGSYIALLDGDDLWEPDFLSVLAGMLDADSTVAAAYPNAIFEGSPRFDGMHYQEVYPATDPVTFDRVLRRECSIFGSLIFRRSALDIVGGFDESLDGQGAEDLDLWLRMLHADLKFVYTTRPLVRYRWRRDSLTNAGESQLRCVISMYEKFLDRQAVTDSQRGWIEAHLPGVRAQLDLAGYRKSLAAGYFNEARSALDRANRHLDSPKLRAIHWGLRLAPSIVRWLALRNTSGKPSDLR